MLHTHACVYIYINIRVREVSVFRSRLDVMPSSLGDAISAWLSDNHLELDVPTMKMTDEKLAQQQRTCAETLINDCWRLHRCRTSQPCAAKPSSGAAHEKNEDEFGSAFGATKRSLRTWPSWWNASRDVRVSASHLPSVPVFTVEWEQMLPSTSEYARAIEEFVDADVASCEEWDTTYLGSETVSHFDLEYDTDETPVSRRVKRSCRLLRYRFSIAGLGMPREMLYLVVEDEDEVRRAKMRVYMSVVDKDGSKENDAWRRITKGYVKATNLMPSFDAWEEVECAGEDGDDAATTTMLLMRHTMTSRLDGWIPDVVWNRLLRVFVERQYMHEGEKVREMLHTRACAIMRANGA